MGAVAISYNQAKPSVFPFSMVDFDPDFTAPSSDIEFQFDEGLVALRHFIAPQQQHSQQLFSDLVSDVVAAIPLLSRHQKLRLSIDGIGEGSLEGGFIHQYHLYSTIQTAQTLIENLFSEHLQIGYEYCHDAEDDSLEWLDINLRCQTEDEAEIEVLLDKLDLLNEKFAEHVEPAKELLINFHLDIV
jgi:hypothetical protein